MPTALHPQTQLTLKFDHQTLPRAYGFPIKIRIPTKLGFKNPKYVTAMWVQNNDAGGYWENQGYNWFSGLLTQLPRSSLRVAVRRAESSRTPRRPVAAILSCAGTRRAVMNSPMTCGISCSALAPIGVR